MKYIKWYANSVPFFLYMTKLNSRILFITSCQQYEYIHCSAESVNQKVTSAQELELIVPPSFN